MFRQQFKVQESEGRLYRRLSQPSRDAILDYVKTLRDTDAVRKTDVLRWTLTIPQIDRMLLGIKYPELDSPDPQIKTRAWKRFIASEESKPYRVSA